MNFSLLPLMVLNWKFSGFHALLTPLNDDLMRCVPAESLGLILKMLSTLIILLRN